MIDTNEIRKIDADVMDGLLAPTRPVPGGRDHGDADRTSSTIFPVSACV
jgi:hypothetical protein